MDNQLKDFRALFVSDLHLKGAHDPKTAVFEAWLRRIKAGVSQQVSPADILEASHLFLLGDIFDLWVGDHDYFVKAYPGICREIDRIVRSGIEVHYFEGNHDFHLENYWSNQQHVQVHRDAVQTEIGGTVVRIEHGDLMNPDDRGYLWLRRFWRNSFMTWSILNAPQSWVAWVGETSSRLSRSRSQKRSENQTQAILEMMVRHTKRVFLQRPFEILISGHTHVRCDIPVQVPSGSTRLVNLGSWYDEPSYFILTPTFSGFFRVSDGLPLVPKASDREPVIHKSHDQMANTN